MEIIVVILKLQLIYKMHKLECKESTQFLTSFSYYITTLYDINTRKLFTLYLT